MLSRQEKIRELARKNRRRRNLEVIVPQLQRIFKDDFDPAKLSILESQDFPQGLSRSWAANIHHIWSFEEQNKIENFCAAFAREVGDINVRVFIPQLETGVLEIALSTALENAVAFLQAFDSLWLYEPQSLAEFEIARHTYYYYGEDVKVPREHKWELDVSGFWAEATRRYLNGG